MKKSLCAIITLFFLFVIIGGAQATLIDNLDGTILDDNTGLLWEQDLSAFANLTYYDQISAIGTHRGGGWRMAGLTDMQGLWNAYNGIQITDAFIPTFEDEDRTAWYGRIDVIYDPGWHNLALVDQSKDDPPVVTKMEDLLRWATYDTFAREEYGAWVVSSPAPVPEPATLLLLGTGLVGLVGYRKKFKK